MTVNTIIILIIIGVAAGMLSGLVGVGGGIIIVPALIYILGFSQKTAQGTSLGLLLLPVFIVSLIYYYKAGEVNIKAIPFLAIGFLVGGYLGSKLALSLPDATVKKIFAFLMIIVAVKMLFFDKPKKDTNKIHATEAQKNKSVGS
ncbi:MAG TPA: sulfite exporter TauE/SafE family protein [Chitinophagaceae bacterium]|nr:sulfite exporter TauE/SafE family protein [Chitinophagaceae bacterium]HMZ47152.1 sulfite exporter TauE/SafE family protein [Chitinophagaceae bacterium]HNE93660.1 sulfite exporter TauE/SafE family protein [Chitinophagaceae bacterium]HNF28661.1 sulfite exporter TauE/SafE family protein [Chitinophagaceae bacterium]HNM34585.1 sulfite exporter TauE/SafE family protein [Chitinophagaceae bacterium]